MLYQTLKWLLFCKITINRAELWDTRVNPKYWKFHVLCFIKIETFNYISKFGILHSKLSITPTFRIYSSWPKALKTMKHKR